MENLNTRDGEIENFEDLYKYIIPSPGDMPQLPGISIYGESIPVNGGISGGDHITYIDFNKRYDMNARIKLAEIEGLTKIIKELQSTKKRAGVLLADASGHKRTDAFLTGRLHDAFLTGVLYELDINGRITTKLFENLNTRIYKSSSMGRYITAIYGEISTDGKFKFISAGHPVPEIFSYEFNSFIKIPQDRIQTSFPLGLLPSEDNIDKQLHIGRTGFKSKFDVNTTQLMNKGDTVVLYTDGLSDHEKEEEYYFPKNLEELLKKTKKLSVKEIFSEIKEDLLKFNKPEDDISIVLIRREF